MSKTKKQSKTSQKAKAEEISENNISEESIQPENIWQRYLAWRKEQKRKEMERRAAKGVVRDWIETIVSVLVIVFFLRVTLVEAFRIPTGSMEDTLLVGDFLLVNKLVYGIRTPDWIGIPYTKAGFSIPYTRLPAFAKPKQGDIIVFRFPYDQRINYIKRCIAVGGQTVEIKNKQVYVDGEIFELPPHGKFTNPNIIPEQIKQREMVPFGSGNKDNYGPVTVPEGHLFMMGDNRDNSADSRYWGFLDQKLVLGKAAVIYFSWDKYAPIYKFWKKIRWWRILNLIK